MRIGIQMYSLRHEIADRGLEEVVGAIAAAGFDGVELAGYYDKTPEELKDLLTKHGLVVSGAHAGADEILSETEKTLAYAKALGYESVVLPWWDPSDVKNDYQEGLVKFRACQKIVEGAGYRFGYHNHNTEFDGRDHLAALAAAMPGLTLEVDTFWLTSMGYDAAEYLLSHRDRIGLVHVKELSEGGTDDYNPVLGEGVTGATNILRAAKEIGAGWAILEAEKIALPYEAYIGRCCRFMREHI